MLSAFRPEAIHELKPRDKSKIECLLAYGDRLLVGLSTGSLRIYRVNESSSEPGPETNGDAPPSKQAKPIELLREDEKFSRKPVQQLAIVKEANLLISLSDGYVAFHDLQTYGLVEKLEKTKGAGCFTVTSNVVKDAETGVPSLVSRLAVGVKRKVLCWTWRDMEMEEPSGQEITAEATVKSLNWVHGSEGKVRLVVGTDPGFSVVDVDAAVVGEGGEEAVKLVYKPTTRTETENGQLAGVRFGAVSGSGMGYMGMSSWVPKPMATAMAPDMNQVLLAKDVNSLFVDLEGKALEKRQVPWHAAPESIGYSYPYLLALQPPEKGSLQIRNPDTLSLLQTISVPSATILHVPQPNISLAHAGKGFIVASDRTIWRMNALPYDAQLRDLVERQRFDEATSLLELLEDTLIDDKHGRIREIKTLKAINLFQQQKYRPALDLFVEAEAPPERVIALYPRSIAGDLSSIPELAKSSENETTAENGHDSDEAPPPPSTKEPPVTPSKGMLSKFRPSRNESDTASVRSVSRTTEATPAKTLAADTWSKPLEGDDLKLATRCLCSFLAQARVQIQKYLSSNGELKQSPPDHNPETGKPSFANLLPDRIFQEAKEKGQDLNHLDWQAELLETAKLVDTTLFRAYVLALPSLAGPLFRLDNSCDPAVVQESLYESKRYRDLIDFLHGKKLHRQALELLTKFGKGEDSPATAEEEDDQAEGEVPEEMRGPDRTVAYLKQLPPELVDLVLEFVRWPLEVDGEKGIEVFLADSENAEKLPRQRVVNFLREVDERFEERYLEHIINELGEGEKEFHQRMVDIYISQLKNNGKLEDPDTEALKTKLESFLRKSKTYNQAATFRQLPQDDPLFFEARAIVLSAMGNHKQALGIYVFQLKDYAKAEAYCNEIYTLTQQQQQTHQGENCLLNPNVQHTTPQQQRSLFATESQDSTENVYALLLGLYLRPPRGEENHWPAALDLLSRHGARLPASSTLDLLPDDLAINELASYFQGRMRSATSTLRQTSIVKALAGVRKVNTEREWLLGKDGAKGLVGQGRNARVRIAEEDHCRVCHKRFGASAVKVWPDGVVVHYGCRRQGMEGAREGMGNRKASGVGRDWG